MRYIAKYSLLFKLVILVFLFGVSYLAAILFSEIVNVGILGNIEGYPWGSKCCENMEHYENPEIYTLTSSLWLLGSVALLFIGWWMLSKINDVKKKFAQKD